MSHNIRFGTFNIGSGFGDYYEMLKGYSEQIKPPSSLLSKLYSHFFPTSNPFLLLQDEMKQIQQAEKKKYSPEQLKTQEVGKSIQRVVENTIMERIEPVIAQKLAGRCDAISLQEVTDINRPFVKTLEREGFKLYFPSGSNPQQFSNGVALRTSKFGDVENISILSESTKEGDANLKGGFNRVPILGQEIAAVIATVKGTSLKIGVASLHCWGLELSPPGTPIDQITAAYSRYTKGVNLPRINKYIEEAIRIFENHSVAFKMIAGDMNNNPHNYKLPFEALQKAGYHILEPNEATDINAVDKDSNHVKPLYLYRKIDYFFSSQPLSRAWSSISSIFACKAPIFSLSAPKVMKEIYYSLTGNCSDHRAVVVDLSIKTQSTVAWLWSFLSKSR